MKVYVISFRHILKYISLLILIALLISVVSIAGMDVLGVFSPEKELPIYCVETSEKKAAITFDCAWGADDIPQILDTLKSRNVKATFFIVGQWALKYPDKVKMITAEGHDVANHSYSHLRMGALDQARIRNEIQLCGSTLSDLTGSKINLFRPPYGDFSNNVVATARKLGYYTIQWNVDGIDIKVKQIVSITPLFGNRSCPITIKEWRNQAMLLTKKDLKQIQENMRVSISLDLEKKLLTQYGNLVTDDEGHVFEYTEQDIYEQLRKRLDQYDKCCLSINCISF